MSGVWRDSAASGRGGSAPNEGAVSGLWTAGSRGRAGVEIRILGEESCVLVESARFPGKTNTYLDHDPEDRVTEKFLRGQPGKLPSFERSFMGDINGIIQGAAEGLGRAVVPKHLLGAKPGVRVVKGFKPCPVPVVLHYFSQPYYSKLHQEAVRALTEKGRAFL